MADEQDPALAVGVHDRLIRRARLKVVVADEPHVEIGDGVGRRSRRRCRGRRALAARRRGEHERRER
jgi:hypothetical protein